MFLNALKLSSNKNSLQLLMRHCSLGLGFVDFNTKFSEEQQQQILNTLNNRDVQHLSQLGIPLNRIKNLKTWQHKKGPFKSLIDVLEVDGLGVKVLEKICTNIVTNQITPSLNNTGTSRRQYLSPALTKEHMQGMKSAIGLHLGPAGISWAKLSRENELLNWSFFKFPEVTKKGFPTDNFKLVVSVLEKIPPADVYIFEQTPHRASLTTGQNITHNQYLEVLAMLLALINTSPVHNFEFANKTQQNRTIQNCVYYLRSNLSARLFRTLMGTERVSSTLAVNQLMEGVTSDDFHFKVAINTTLKDDYLCKNAIGKELLGQALLLIVAFMEICIRKNTISLAIVSRSKKIANVKK